MEHNRLTGANVGRYMETRRDRLIRAALERGRPAAGQSDDPEDAAPASLRDQALDHTADDYVPRTLTPHEWEAYYAAHGVPPQHRRQASQRDSFWRRLLRRLGGTRRRPARNCARSPDEDTEF